MTLQVQTEFEVEFRNFMGLDTRRDRSLIPYNYLTDHRNEVLVQGVWKCREGSSRWGDLDFSGTGSGTFRGFLPVDVGTEDNIVAHRGARLYFGLKDSSIPTVINDLAGNPLVVTDAESEFLPYGYSVGSGSAKVVKVLFKQAAGCKILEYDGATWKGRSAGIDTSTFSFAVSEVAGGTAQPLGTFRVRLVAMRQVAGVRTNESAPIGKATEPTDYQEVEITSATNRIQITVTHSGLDSQVTHFQAQVTRPLNFPTGSVYSDNGNDPTLFFETAAVAVGVSPQTFQLDVSDLTLVCPDLFGYEPIPGHLISDYAGGILFFGGVTPYPSRIYKSGISGFFYHNELYDPFEFYAADEGDGQQLIAISKVSDHLFLAKETKTGIVPNMSLDAAIVWRDLRLGLLHRKAVGRLSKDTLVCLNNDGVLRRFDGVGYIDRVDPLEPRENPFSDKVLSLSEDISPATVDFVFHKDRLHIIHGDADEREALVLHSQENFAWARWEGLTHEFSALAENGQDWIYYSAGKLWQQNVENVFTQEGAEEEIAWTATFVGVRPKDSPRSIIKMYRCSVEGFFTSAVSAVLDCNNGYIETNPVNLVPNPADEENQFVQWFNVYPDTAAYGNFIVLTLTGTGDHFVRAINWDLVERVGRKPISQGPYDPSNLTPDWAQALYDAQYGDRDTSGSDWDELDAEFGDRDTSTDDWLEVDAEG
jgi:hypothetical protein